MGKPSPAQPSPAQILCIMVVPDTFKVSVCAVTLNHMQPCVYFDRNIHVIFCYNVRLEKNKQLALLLLVSIL